MGSELSLDAITWQMVLNFLSMEVIQFVKIKEGPLTSWLNQNTPRLTKFISLIIATGTAVGIHLQFQVAHGTPGAYSLSVTGLTIVAVIHMCKDILQNYYGIKIAYRLAKPDEFVRPTYPSVPADKPFVPISDPALNQAAK